MNEDEQLKGEFNSSLQRLGRFIDELEQEKAEYKQRAEEAENKLVEADRYAAAIQQALFPSKRYLDRYFNEYFVFYRPKEVVEGDFFYFTEKDGLYYLAVVDCTGYSVTSAYMSISGFMALNRAVYVYGYKTAPEVLTYLRRKMGEAIKLTEKTSSLREGLDIALVIYNPETRELRYSGAYISATLYHKGELVTLESDKIPLNPLHDAEMTDVSFDFNEKVLTLTKNDFLYLYTDGIVNQFGGPDGKKLLHKRLQEWLKEVFPHSASRQKEEIEKSFEEWKGDASQLDDVLLWGVRL